MGLLLLILPVCWACVGAESPMEVRVELGQNVTLNCSLDTKNIFWYMEIHSRFRGCIARVISEGRDQQYFVSTAGTTKYVVLQVNRLLITNVTAEDCRRYFCGRRQEDKIVFKDVFHVATGFREPTADSTEGDNTHTQDDVYQISGQKNHGHCGPFCQTLSFTSLSWSRCSQPSIYEGTTADGENVARECHIQLSRTECPPRSNR